MDVEGSSRFMALPLEMRLKIYDHASERPTGTKLILKEYLEKIDSDIGPPQPTPVVATIVAPASTAAPLTAVIDPEEDSEMEEADHEADEEMEDEGDDVEDQEEVDADMAEAEVDDVAVPAAAPTTSSAIMSVQDMITAAAIANIANTDAAAIEDGEEENDDDEDDGEENGEEDNGEEDDEQYGDEDSEEDEEDTGEDDQGADGGAASIPRNGRATKYRHILPIIKISRNPPPISLLQTCQQIHAEATAYHRSKCTMTIDVNKAFPHFSMFQETLEAFVTAPSSPLEQIRKMHLVITWDSEWLREKTAAGTVDKDSQAWYFPFYFNERLQVVVNLVKACPELRNVKIDWHDSEDTEDSRALMAEKLSVFFEALGDKTWLDTTTGINSNVDIDFKEHFSAAGTAHARNSLLALRRTEFDLFVQSGLYMR